MSERKEYELTAQQFQSLLDACKPTPAMYLSGGTPMCGTPQENANRAWCALGKELGFDGMTVEPSRKGQRFFTALVSSAHRGATAFSPADSTPAQRLPE